jgi:hypothetical protein
MRATAGHGFDPCQNLSQEIPVGIFDVNQRLRGRGRLTITERTVLIQREARRAATLIPSALPSRLRSGNRWSDNVQRNVGDYGGNATFR